MFKKFSIALILLPILFSYCSTKVMFKTSKEQIDTTSIKIIKVDTVLAGPDKLLRIEFREKTKGGGK